MGMNGTAVRVCRAWAPFSGAAVAVLGLVGFAGWVFDSEALKSAFTGGVTMKSNAAIGLALLGLALLLLAPEREATPNGAQTLGRAMAAVAAVIGGLTLAQHVGGLDFGIDQLLFTEPPGAAATTSPGRMGPPASLSYLLLGMALLALDARPWRRVPVAQALGVVVALVSLVPLIGYAYDIEPLYGVSKYTGIAVHTAAGILLLAMGLIAARPGRGAMALVCADNVGGLMARSLLPAAVLIPLVLGWVRTTGARAGLIDDAVGRPLLILGMTVSFAALILWTARALTRVDAQRREAEAAVRRALRAEQHARAAAERAGRIKDDFLATLSHELRTPMSAIFGWSQMLLAREMPAETVRQGLETIERNARAQSRLIEDLLDMSRIISGKIRLDVGPVDLGTLVAAALEVVRPAADAKGVTLESSPEAGPGTIAADANRLQQVLWNLLSNAVKFTPRGGRVRVSLRESADRVDLVVSDTGEGMLPEFLPHVFDRFRQADGSITRTHGGLGLGLAIVRQLVELHGGTARAESDGPGKGSTFTVTLPRATLASMLPAPEAAPRAETDEARRPNGRRDLTGVRALVVEDEPDVRDLVKRMLEEHGARVATAASAAEAMRLLPEARPDVIVSDVGMPGEDGYSFIKRVRATGDGWARVPVLALTAYTRREDRERALASGFDEHLGKPVEAWELVGMVGALVDRKPMHDER